MKILMAHSRYRSQAPSGENNVVDRESALLAAAGHQVELYQRQSDDIAGWGLAGKAALPARSIWNARVRDELACRLDATRPDVVHVHNTFPLLSASVLHACMDMGVPVVATIHNSRLLCASGDFFRDGAPCHACGDGRRLPAMLHGCYRDSRLATAPVVAALVLNRPAWRSLVSAYVFVSSPHRDVMRGLGLPEERVFLKHNFVVSAPVAEASPRKHAVAYIGRLDDAKGVPFLMRSWTSFRKEHPDSSLRLVVAGAGPLQDSVRRWAATHESVDFVGLLPSDEAAALLRRSLAVILPSQVEETFGLVVAEAMAAGVAPLAAAHGSFPDLVGHGIDGALFAPHDQRDLVRLLQEVDTYPERFIDYGRQARSTYESRFSPDVTLAKLLAIYRFAITHPVARNEAVSTCRYS